MTILEVLESTTKYFVKHEVASPRLTIELMLAEILSKTRMQLYMNFGEDLKPETLDKLRPLVKRRADGEPLEYILGVTTFAGKRIFVTPATLIPRTDTELLLEAVKSIFAPGSPTSPIPSDSAIATEPIAPVNPLPILDVGTGSGAISCALAHAYPNLPIYAVDISPAALEIARKNAAEFSNIFLLESDLLTNAELPRQFHVIIANLPYIPRGVMQTLSREVKYEPVLALDGGIEGTELIERLIEQSRGMTQWLALEFGDGQAEKLKTLCQKHGYHVTRVVQDFTERDRILVAQYHG